MIHNTLRTCVGNKSSAGGRFYQEAWARRSKASVALSRQPKVSSKANGLIMSDVNELLIQPLQKFSKDSMHLIKKCTKPDRKGKFVSLWYSSTICKALLGCGVVSPRRWNSSTFGSILGWCWYPKNAQQMENILSRWSPLASETEREGFEAFLEAKRVFRLYGVLAVSPPSSPAGFRPSSGLDRPLPSWSRIHER